jgi:hypothetical protein
LIALVRLWVVSLAVFLCWACDGDSKSPSDDSSSGSGGDTRPPQQGNRLTWEQFATSHDQVVSFAFRLYVDNNNPQTLNDVRCAPASASPYTCSGPLPTLSVGHHTLMLSAVSGTLESSPSAPVQINVGGLDTSSAEIALSRPASTLDTPSTACVIESAVCHPATLIVRTTKTISSPAALDHEKALYVEGEHDVRVVVGSTLVREPALTVDSSIRIIGAAVDTAFETTRHVYLATIELGDGGSRNLIVARYREVANQLGERAVVVTEQLAPTGDPQMALDAQNQIYVAMPASERSVGQLIRFTLDGWTPPGQAEPRLASGFDDPTSIAVERSTGRVWLAGRGAPGMSTLRSLPSGGRFHEVFSAAGLFESLVTTEPDKRTGISSLFGVSRRSLRRVSIDTFGKTSVAVLTVPSGEATAVGPHGRTNILVATRNHTPSHDFTLWRVHLD